MSRGGLKPTQRNGRRLGLILMSATDAVTTDAVPETAQELCGLLAANSSGAARPIYPVGGRTGLGFGYPITDPGIQVDLTRLTRVIDYPARDMTITVEAGIRIAELTRILQAEGQRLPIDIPHPEQATLGGALATNVSGPRRFGLGTLRDYVIGITAVDATGQEFKAGGRVVKNVAGYDLCKVLIGALGTLGVVSQVTLKLRPIPAAARLLAASFSRLADIEPVLARLQSSAARPNVMEVLESRAAAEITRAAGWDHAESGALLLLAVEGTEHDTRWQLDTLQQEIQAFLPASLNAVPDALIGPMFAALTGFQAGGAGGLSFKANLQPSQTIEFLSQAHSRGCAAQAHAGSGVVVGHCPPEIRTPEAAAALLFELQATAAPAGDVVVLSCPDAWKSRLPLFGSQPAGAWGLMRNLKRQLDPRDLLNRGRLLGHST